MHNPSAHVEHNRGDEHEVHADHDRSGVCYFSRLAQREDIPQLTPLLYAPEISNSVRVAATLLRLGNERGLPLLIAAWESDETQLLSEPPLPVADYAQDVLAVLRPGLVDGPFNPIQGEIS